MDHTFKRANGKILGFAEYGDRHGTPLFSFHGWPSSRLQGHVYDRIAKDLGIRIIAPDRPGYGLSGFDPVRTLLDWPDTVTELADHLRIRNFSVVGISGGGPYAAVCAYKIPGRLRKAGIVVGLGPTYVSGILDGMPWFARMLWQNYGRVGYLPVIASGSYELLNHVIPLYGVYSHLFGARADKDIFRNRDVREDFKMITGEAFRSGLTGPAYDLELYARDWGFDLSKIHKHVYLWYGREDTNVPVATAEYYHRVLPKNTLTVYPGEGHMIIRTHAREMLSVFIG